MSRAGYGGGHGAFGASEIDGVKEGKGSAHRQDRPAL